MNSSTERQKELNSENEYLRQVSPAGMWVIYIGVLILFICFIKKKKKKKKVSSIQMDNANYSNTQARLETQLYAQEQDMDDLRKEIQQSTKGRKDAEKKLSSEVTEKKNKVFFFFFRCCKCNMDYLLL
jgi:septal ring factor EnvC (AmiA/AmiB activator)